MTDRVSIPQLRRLSDRPDDPSDRYLIAYERVIGKDDLSALLDAADALRILERRAREGRCDEDPGSWLNAADVLARLDFGEET